MSPGAIFLITNQVFKLHFLPSYPQKGSAFIVGSHKHNGAFLVLQVGRLWTSLADFYIRRGMFERARDVYEEGLNSVSTVGALDTELLQLLHMHVGRLHCMHPNNRLHSAFAWHARKMPSCTAKGGGGVGKGLAWVGVLRGVAEVLYSF
jgi:pentatricopeptide repeat protein